MGAPDPRLGTLLAGRYRIEERLGAGGMGVVYRAERVGTDQRVAIKFLSAAAAAQRDLVKRFQREVKVMHRLAHPHLTGVIDSGVDAGAPFLVMDFHQGRPLGDVLADGSLSGPRAAGIARQILSGIGYLHTGGVVHRDLKPDNIILLDDDSRGDFIKILDFGLARIHRGEGEDATKISRSGHAMGTPSYMSPEQAKGEKADRRSDLYSIGVILYGMVTGQKPFSSKNPMDVVRMHIHEAPVPPRTRAPGSCSPELEHVILRALEKLPARRYATAEGFARAIEITPEGRESSVPEIELARREIAPRRTAASPPPPETAPPPAKERPRPMRARRFLLLALFAATLVATALVRPDLPRRAVTALVETWRSLTAETPR